MIDFKLIEDTGKTITLALDSTDTTLINPIMDVLNNDTNVKLSRYIVVHPELEDPQLVVEVFEESPISAKEALINAANYVSEYFSNINSSKSDWYVPQNISHSSYKNSFLDEKTADSPHSKKITRKDGYPAEGE